MPLRILVVEDEMTIALMVEDMLCDLGHEVADVQMRLDPALAAARQGDFDFALLDVNLDGRMSFPVAEILKSRGIPFAFTTGYGAAGLDASFRDRPVLVKPFLLAELEQLIAGAVPPEGQ